jgi:hypothetical protein
VSRYDADTVGFVQIKKKCEMVDIPSVYSMRRTSLNPVPGRKKVFAIMAHSYTNF